MGQVAGPGVQESDNGNEHDEHGRHHADERDRAQRELGPAREEEDHRRKDHARPEPARRVRDLGDRDGQADPAREQA